MKDLEAQAAKKTHEASALARKAEQGATESHSLKEKCDRLEAELTEALQALEVEKYNNAVLTNEVGKYKSGAADLQNKTMQAQQNLVTKNKELEAATETKKVGL